MEDDFTSGPWTGFYSYDDSSRGRMDLSLSFREGVVTGTGSDPVGNFSIRGRYDAERNGIRWTKTYPGLHSVEYKGYRDKRGIWGTWEIGLGVSGGFHLWPKGQGEEEAEAQIAPPTAEEAVRKLKEWGYKPMPPPDSP